MLSHPREETAKNRQKKAHSTVSQLRGTKRSNLLVFGALKA